MKKSIFLFGAIFMAMVLLVGVTSCKDDEEPTAFTLSTLMSGTSNLNAATPPSDVSSTPTIEAVFSVAVNPASVDETKITLYRDYTETLVDIDITVSGSKITIVPVGDLGNGTLYELSFKAGITSTDGQALAPFARAFTTVGTFVPFGVLAYWNFEGTADDQVGAFDPSAVVNVAYQPSYTTAAGTAGYFDGTTSIVEIPNGDQLMATHDFTISFWVKAESAGHVNENGDPKGHFVLGLGAFYGFQFEMPGDYSSCKLAVQYDLGTGLSASEDLWFAGDGNLGWQGWTFCKDLTASGGVAGLLKDKWAFVTCVYESTSKEGTMYINGEKMKAQDFDLWPDGDPKQGIVGLKYGGAEPDVVNELAFGFIQSRAGTMWDTEPWGGYDFPTANHFGGWLDDVRIFHKALTPVEIQLMYDTAKP